MSLSYWSFRWPNNITYMRTPQNRDISCTRVPQIKGHPIIITNNWVIIVRLRYNTVICLLQNTHNKHPIVLLKKHVICKMSFVISKSEFRPLSLLCWVQGILIKHPLYLYLYMYLYHTQQASKWGMTLGWWCALPSGRREPAQGWPRLGPGGQPGVDCA